MMNDELFYEVALSLVPGIGGKQGRKLLQKCGTASGVFRERGQNLARIGGVGYQIIHEIRKKEVLNRAESEIRFMSVNGIVPYFILNDGYPVKLKSCPDAPLILFFKGKEGWQEKRCLAVVGTRKPTDYGKEVTDQIVRGLEKHDILVVSGLAYGIDTWAHRSALLAGLDTVAVMAHGLDQIYPGQNRSLAGQMTGQGGLLTEFASGTKLNRDLFPRRNRIIAGLADALLVVESDLKGGGMITARIASSYNRDVFAIPGQVHNRSSSGPHFLIKTNIAGLVEEASDIIYNMRWDEMEPKPAIQKQMFADLTEDQKMIIAMIEKRGEVLLDELIGETALPPSKISSALLDLEFKGIVKMQPGGRYRPA